MGLVLRNALSAKELTGKGKGMLCPFCQTPVNTSNSWIHENWMGECKICKCWFNL